MAGCSSTEAAKEHEKEGILALQQGRSADALRELRAANEADPGLYQAAIALAALHERAGDRPQALRILERLAEERPRLALAHMARADLLARLGRWDDALRAYARVVEISAHAPALLGMAEIYLRRGEEAAAERAILAALEQQPGDLRARYALARLYDEHGRDERATRAAWERYFGLALADRAEAERVAEARARLRVLSARLSTEERRAALALVRGVLRPPPPGLGAAIEESSTWRPREGAPERAAWDALDRWFSGRVFVTLHAAGAVAVRGTGQGATLAEALAAAGLDAKRSRVFDLQLAQDLGGVRIAVDIEAEAPAPATAATFRPGEDALEVARGGRSSVVLPADQTALGIATFERAVAAAAHALGIDAAAAGAAEVVRFKTAAFVEAAEGDPTPVAIVAGLPEPSAPTARAALATARAAALWVAGTLTPEGLFAEGYDPREDRWLAGVTATATQVDAIAALARLAAAVGEGRLRDAATFAHKKTIAAAAGAGAEAGVPAAAGGGPTGAAAGDLARRLRMTAALNGAGTAAIAAALAKAGGADGGFAGLPREERALAALALAEAGAREAALKAALALAGGDPPEGAALPALGVLIEGAPGDPALEAAARALARRAVEEEPAGDGTDPERALFALEQLVAAARLPPALRPPGVDEALRRAVQATLALAIDDRAAYPFRERGRALGGIRTARLDPAIRTGLILRRAEALARAATVLP